MCVMRSGCFYASGMNFTEIFRYAKPNRATLRRFAAEREATLHARDYSGMNAEYRRHALPDSFRKFALAISLESAGLRRTVGKHEGRQFAMLAHRLSALLFSNCFKPAES